MENDDTMPIPGLGSLSIKKLFLPLLCFIILLIILSTSIHKATSTSTQAPAKSNPQTLSNITSSLASTLKSLPSYLTGSNQDDSAAKNHTIKTAEIATSKKVAVIIETRESAAIIPLILHFSAVLGPDWPIVIYTSTENFGSFSTSEALLRHQHSGRVVIRSLADGLYFPNWDSVSNFLTTPWMWTDLAPAEYLLIFQADSVLCSNSVRSVEDFFEWDLIGAPISPQWGQGYNGGLSLRRRSTTMRVLQEFDWTKNPHPRFEDQWYYFRYENYLPYFRLACVYVLIFWWGRMKDLIARDIEEFGESKIKLPSMEIARTFAVETIDYPSPLGLQ